MFQLYNDVAEYRKDPSTVEMISYNSTLGYGHYDITLDPSIGNVTKYVNMCLGFYETLRVYI